MSCSSSCSAVAMHVCNISLATMPRVHYVRARVSFGRKRQVNVAVDWVRMLTRCPGSLVMRWASTRVAFMHCSTHGPLPQTSTDT